MEAAHFMGNQSEAWNNNAKAVYFLSSAGPAVILACLGVGRKMYGTTLYLFRKVGNQLDQTLPSNLVSLSLREDINGMTRSTRTVC